MSEVLQVEQRGSYGTRHARRLRAAGRIPAILYGHGEECVSLSLDASQVGAAVRHGSRIVELEGALREKALIREIQWDPFGVDVLHLDLTRVAADEKVAVNLPVELRGVAPGTNEGGVVEHPVHELEIECPAAKIPEKLVLNINNLQLGESLTAAALELPEGARLTGSPDTVVAQCVEPHVEAEMEEAPESVEPEVIGRKPSEEEAEAGGA